MIAVAVGIYIPSIQMALVSKIPLRLRHLWSKLSGHWAQANVAVRDFVNLAPPSSSKGHGLHGFRGSCATLDVG